MTGIYLQTAAALVFVILLIIGAGYVFRKKQNRFGLMTVVSYQPFGPKRGVAALKVGKEILILGLSQNDMRLLKVFRDDELELNQGSGFQGKFEKLINAGAGRS